MMLSMKPPYDISPTILKLISSVSEKIAEHFINLGIKEFTRKDYMTIFKDLSSATATRDLKKGVELNI